MRDDLTDYISAHPEKQPRLSDLVFIPFSVRQQIQEAIDNAPDGRQADIAVKMTLNHLRPELDRLQNAIAQPLADRDGLQNGGS